MYASTSITSPAKNSPPIFFDIIVFGESSATDTPPEVTIASSIGQNDREREIAPCVPAEDVVMFDNSELDFDGTVEEALRIIREKTE